MRKDFAAGNVRNDWEDVLKAGRGEAEAPSSRNGLRSGLRLDVDLYSAEKGVISVLSSSPALTKASRFR